MPRRQASLLERQNTSDLPEAPWEAGERDEEPPGAAQQQFYYHHALGDSGHRTRPRPMRIDSRDGLVLIHHSTLEFYTVGEEVRLHHLRRFPLQLLAVEVLPWLHRRSDAVLVVDVCGRWALWHLDEGFLFVDQLHSRESRLAKGAFDLLNGLPGPGSSGVFSGVHCRHELRDVEGVAFFACEETFVEIGFRTSKDGVAPTKTQLSLPWRAQHIGLAEWRGRRLVGIVHEGSPERGRCGRPVDTAWGAFGADEGGAESL